MEPQTVQREMQELLTPAKARVQRARLHRALLQAGDVLLAGVLMAAVLLLVNAMLPADAAVLRGMALIVALAALIAAGVVVYVRSMRRPVSWEEAAERLDAATNRDNLIETAWSLRTRIAGEPFAAAAVEQGLTLLRQRRDQAPIVPETPVGWSRKAPLLAAIVFCLVAHGFLPARGTADQPIAHVPGSGDESARLIAGSAPAPQDNTRSPEPAAPRTHPQLAAQRATAASQPSLAAARASQRQQSMHSRSQTVGQSAGAQRSSASENTPPRSASKEGPGRVMPSEKRPTRSSPARLGAPGSESQQLEENASASSNAGQGAGAGQTLALANRSSTRDVNAQEDPCGDESEQKLEEQAKGNQQRGGVQPSLPDRTAAPSRELGITGPQSGKPGTGRGGPSPVKKSRGVASLLMGVALPDFVRGKTGPGPAAVNFEEIEPVPAPEPTPAGREPMPRSVEESALRRAAIPWADQDVVRRVLPAMHSLDHASVEMTTTAPAGPAKAGTP